MQIRCKSLLFSAVFPLEGAQGWASPCSRPTLSTRVTRALALASPRPTHPGRLYALHLLAHGALHGRNPEICTQSTQWLMCAPAALHSGTFHSAGPFPAPRSAPLRCPRAIAARPSRPLYGPRLGALICGESAPACLQPVQPSPLSDSRTCLRRHLRARAARRGHHVPPTTLPMLRTTRTSATCSSCPAISPEASAAG